jgi:DNA-directed RNA polymerase specialized sigma24 family protein
MGGLADALAKLRSGEMTFSRFYSATLRDWDRMAAKLFGRWRLPCGVTEEDVRQEMLLAAWRSTMSPPPKGWDPNRGIPLATYVVWTAHACAKKWIHTQRKAKRRDDSAPSRHAVAVSGMNLDSEGELGLAGLLDVLHWREADQESSAEGRAALKLLPRCAEGERGRAALEAWLRAGGDVADAAASWYEDSKQRLRWRLECEEHAAKLIQKELARVGDQFGI